MYCLFFHKTLKLTAFGQDKYMLNFIFSSAKEKSVKEIYLKNISEKSCREENGGYQLLKPFFKIDQSS